MDAERFPLSTIYDGAIVEDGVVLDEGSIVGQDSWVGRGSVIGRGVRLNRRNLVDDCHIGDFTYTGQDTVLKHANIGKFCSISWSCSIAGGTHDPSCITTHPFPRLSAFGFTDDNLGIEARRIRLGNDVWVGTGAAILPGVSVGHGSVIGAGSVVTRDVPPYAIVAGVPARVIRMRFNEDVVRELLRLRWWDWPDEVIRQNVTLFRSEGFDSDQLERLREIANTAQK